MSEIQMKPCPFCGSASTYAIARAPTGIVQHHTQCKDCGAETRPFSAPELSNNFWNSRAAQPSVPDGWKLVPVEPTPEMLEAQHGQAGPRACYQAMLATAPTPPSSPQPAPRLYQHTDGRYGLSFGPAKFAVNAPEWYSVPLDVVEEP